MCSRTFLSDADESLIDAKIIGELEDGLRGWDTKDRWGDVGIKEQVANTFFEWACS